MIINIGNAMKFSCQMIFHCSQFGLNLYICLYNFEKACLILYALELNDEFV